MPLKSRMDFGYLPSMKAVSADGQQAESVKPIQTALKEAVQRRYASLKKKALLLRHANGENVIMPVNTKSPANALKTDANGANRNENKKYNREYS